MADLIALNVFSVSLIFAILIAICLGLFHFELILHGALGASWTLMSVFLPRLGKFSVFSYYVFSSFSGPFFLSLILLGPL